MQYRPAKSPGWLLSAYGPREGKIYVCPDSHYRAHYDEQMNEVSTKTLQVEKFALPRFSAFLGNEYVEDAGGEHYVIQTLVIPFPSSQIISRL